MDVPGAGHGLPEVLVVGEALEPWAELAAPVVLELVEEEPVPGQRCRGGHADTMADNQDRFCPLSVADFDRVRHDRARPEAPRAVPAAARVDRARARRAARRDRPQRAPRRRAPPRPRLSRQRHAGCRRRLPAGRGHGAAAVAARRRGGDRHRGLAPPRGRRHRGRAPARPPCARSPSSTRCCRPGCAPRCARCTTRSPPSTAAGWRWTPTPCWCWRARPATTTVSS